MTGNDKWNNVKLTVEFASGSLLRLRQLADPRNDMPRNDIPRYGIMVYMVAFCFLFFVLGLVVGSFLNVLIYRLPRGLNAAKGRSFCPKCKKKISWYDNIPLLSFVLLKGRCRRCGKKISWRYPVVELLTAVTTILIFNLKFEIFNEFLNYKVLNFQITIDLVLTLVLVYTLIVVFFTDLETMVIPDEVILPTSLLLLIRYGLTDYRLVTGISAFAFIGLIYLLTKKKGMGFGDVKFALLMGLALGYPNIIIAFYIAFLTGTLVGIILIVLGKAKWKNKIAFGPFLCLGTFVAYFWGNVVVNWAVRLFL